MQKNSSPVVILVRPQMGENIGAVARAMSNFGLRELRIAAPRDGWPNPKALEMAAGAESIIESAKIFPDFKAAMADVQLAYATTARKRDMEKRVVEPDVAMQEIKQLLSSPLPNPPPQAGEGIKIALVFGPERSGLENDEVTWCDTLITIPTAPENSSLNIAQSAVILGYEWFRQGTGFIHLRQGFGGQRIQDSGETPESLAPRAEWEGLFGQLEHYLDQAEYFRVAHKKPVMWQNLQTMFLRSQLSSQEVRTLRGMFRSLWERAPERD